MSRSYVTFCFLIYPNKSTLVLGRMWQLEGCFLLSWDLVMRGCSPVFPVLRWGEQDKNVYYVFPSQVQESQVTSRGLARIEWEVFAFGSNCVLWLPEQAPGLPSWAELFMCFSIHRLVSQERCMEELVAEAAQHGQLLTAVLYGRSAVPGSMAGQAWLWLVFRGRCKFLCCCASRNAWPSAVFDGSPFSDGFLPA